MKFILAALPANRAYLCFLLLVLLLLSYHLKSSHAMERLYLWSVTQWHEAESRKLSVWLPDYRADIDGRVLEKVFYNLSGITFDPQRKISVGGHQQSQ